MVVPVIEYYGSEAVASVFTWTDVMHEGKRLQPLVYRFGAFLAEGELGKKEMLEIFVPLLFDEQARCLAPVYAHHVQVSDFEAFVHVNTIKTPIYTPARLFWYLAGSEEARTYADMSEDLPSQIVGFYRELRERLLFVGEMPQWADVLNKDAEDRLAESAKSFAQPMTTMLKYMSNLTNKMLPHEVVLTDFAKDLFPHTDWMAYAHSRQQGPVKKCSIITAIPNDGIPCVVDDKDFYPLTMTYQKSGIYLIEPEDTQISSASMNMRIPPALQQRLQLKKIHHEAYLNPSGGVYHTRMMAVGMLDENNPGVLMMMGLQELSAIDETHEIRANFYVAPLLSLPQMKYKEFQKNIQKRQNWLNLVA